MTRLESSDVRVPGALNRAPTNSGLDGAVVIVTGATPGDIGAATAVRLALEAATVVVADPTESAAQALVAEIRELDGTAAARSFDVGDEASYKALIDSTVSEFGWLDGLFNVAGDIFNVPAGFPVDEIEQHPLVDSILTALSRHTIDDTLTGYTYAIRHALPVMIEQAGGVIINAVSTGVWTGADRHVAYQGLTRHTARLGGKHGVRSNSVAAGVILTRAALASTTEEWRTEILASLRSPRLGIPEDVAAVVSFLFSDDAAYVNGQTIHVDRGDNFT
jgi:NAD(P)-dependent dehydrogenase (short-subunit alcohol dehydrogenase family)